MVDQHREREVDLSTAHNLENVEQRLELDIKRLQMLLSRIKNDTQNPARAETIRVYSEMLEAREDLLNQIQLQRLSLQIEQRAAV
jgi:hypothetical protein